MAPLSPMLKKPNGVTVVFSPSKSPSVATLLSAAKPVAVVPNRRGSAGARCAPGANVVPPTKSKTAKPTAPAAQAAVAQSVLLSLMASRSKPENCPDAPPRPELLSAIWIDKMVPRLKVDRSAL